MLDKREQEILDWAEEQAEQEIREGFEKIGSDYEKAKKRHMKRERARIKKEQQPRRKRSVLRVVLLVLWFSSAGFAGWAIGNTGGELIWTAFYGEPANKCANRLRRCVDLATELKANMERVGQLTGILSGRARDGTPPEPAIARKCTVTTSHPSKRGWVVTSEIPSGGTNPAPVIIRCLCRDGVFTSCMSYSDMSAY